MAKKKVLIEVLHGEELLVCDNKECFYKMNAKTDNPVKEMSFYINKPCPLCGHNLLTERDYRDYKNMMVYINWVNRWFSWLRIFNFSKRSHCKVAHVHNGVNIEKCKTDVK